MTGEATDRARRRLQRRINRGERAKDNPGCCGPIFLALLVLVLVVIWVLVA